MTKFFWICVCCLCGTLTSFSQSEMLPVALPQEQDTMRSEIEIPLHDRPMVEPVYFAPSFASSLFLMSGFDTPADVDGRIPLIDWNGSHSLPSWMGFSSTMETYPGLMQVESGAVAYTGNSGKLSYTAYLGAVKYGTFNSLVTSYFAGGQVSYRLNPHISFTAFGTYYSRNPYLGMAAFPYVQTTNFGGYMTLAPSSSFSLSLGARSYYDPFSRRMEVDPIIAPTVKVGKVRIGIDIGHAAKNYVRSLFKSWSK